MLLNSADFKLEAMVSTSGMLREMQALDLNAEGQELWGRGCLEEALSLMQESVKLRERSHTICLSLSELGGIYLEMLKIDEAEETARRMLREAHRYDTAAQTGIAQQLLKDAKEERTHGFHYGCVVMLHGLKRIDLNGLFGEVRGRVWPQTSAAPDRYRILVGSSLLSVRRGNIALATVVVQLAIEVKHEGLLLHGMTMSGESCATISMDRSELTAKAVRRGLADHMGRQMSLVKIVLPNGTLVEDGPAGGEMLNRYADEMGQMANADWAMCSICSNRLAQPRPSDEKLVCEKCVSVHERCIREMRRRGAEEDVEELSVLGEVEYVFAIGIRRQLQGDLSRARECYEEAHSKGLVAATSILGRFCSALGELDRGRTLLEEARSKGEPSASCSLGLVCAEQGDFSGARKFWDEVRSSGVRTLNDEVDEELFFKLGNEHALEGGMGKARQLWEEAGSSGHAEAIHNLQVLDKMQSRSDPPSVFTQEQLEDTCSNGPPGEVPECKQQ